MVYVHAMYKYKYGNGSGSKDISESTYVAKSPYVTYREIDLLVTGMRFVINSNVLFVVQYTVESHLSKPP